MKKVSRSHALPPPRPEPEGGKESRDSETKPRLFPESVAILRSRVSELSARHPEKAALILGRWIHSKKKAA